MGRISRQAMFMEMARAASKRSTCSRLNVGAIITKDNSPISVGYGGVPAGQPHCPGNDCPGMIPGNCPTVHAEENALARAEAVLEWGNKVDLYVTHSPCLACAELIQRSNLRVERLFFEVPYRSTKHLGMFEASYYHQPGGSMSLRSRRITEVYEIGPAGYIVEYFSRRVVELP